MAGPRPKAAPAPGKAVAKVEPKGPAPVTQDMLSLFAQDSGAGLEHTTAADYALPFIYLLQDNSPQAKKRDEKYVDGAEPGMFLNTVTNDLYTELTVIPVEFEKVYNEWIPRDDGGGFVASYRDKSEAMMNKQDNTDIIDTANHYVLVKQKDGTWAPAIFTCTSTKLKASRNWLSRIRSRLITGPKGRVIAPSYSGIYVISSIATKNQKGEFFTIRVDPVEGNEGWVTDHRLYQMAKDFAEQLKAGQKGADYSKAEDAELVDEEEEEAGAKY